MSSMSIMSHSCILLNKFSLFPATSSGKGGLWRLNPLQYPKNASKSPTSCRFCFVSLFCLFAKRQSTHPMGIIIILSDQLSSNCYPQNTKAPRHDLWPSSSFLWRYADLRCSKPAEPSEDLKNYGNRFSISRDILLPCMLLWLLNELSFSMFECYLNLV